MAKEQVGLDATFSFDNKKTKTPKKYQTYSIGHTSINQTYHYNIERCNQNNDNNKLYPKSYMDMKSTLGQVFDFVDTHQFWFWGSISESKYLQF